MMNQIATYFRELADGVAGGWNRFWFAKRDPQIVCLLRVLTGLLALYFVGSFTTELSTWFAANGILPSETIWRLTGESEFSVGGADSVYRWSYLHLVDSPSLLMVVHIAGLLVVLAYTVGLFSRITNVLSLVVVLSYIHRATVIAGMFEPVLAMLLLYLCFAPTDAIYSLDNILRRRRGSEWVKASVSANIATRLLQVHTAAFVLMMGHAKLTSGTWAAGNAMWWLIARTESRLVDLTFLHESIELLNMLSHSVVVVEILFPILIWFRLSRPLFLGISAIVWFVLILITGEVAFYAAVMVACLSFIDPAFVGAIFTTGRTEPTSS
ncbi:MAG: hypothetical protein ACI9G1_000707 [Pirellulaceae bacterium]|jgi:hypothetical protein